MSTRPFLLALALTAGAALAQGGMPIVVTPDNFSRAETDREFGVTVKSGGFGKFHHIRELLPIEKQTVVRGNRDTLYSAGVFDLDAGPLTVTLPDAGTRFMSMQLIDQDHYVPAVVYGAGRYTYTRQQVGTRYVLIGIRTLVDPADPADVKQAHALQDALSAIQPNVGSFETPDWDDASRKKVGEALIQLAATIPDTQRMFGARGKVDPVRHLVGAATGWGGNPENAAMYVTVVPPKNDGQTVHRLTVKDVPVDGFWSISVYDAKGYYQKNPLNAYTVNNLTAQKDADGSTTVQFGGCDGKVSNCIPIMDGWNYWVRLYRPRPEILSGKWRFPEAQPAH
ncbi:DUF1254 domain-containing protein [Roseateles violae]|uniref:DUF1254 domain-containing protein n=1 Tax=Roseateles violae TaxID=3058042 RepID=A0ABT8DYA3_9BURK|nr:DUF1254 domain-containing protein [Pelomonas sp. PFR6]MDN3922171.1 DUF1254 domain-containing protein [Pelomonas sp. PFR6]